MTLKKYNCIDLFCGAGGLALGMEKAGFEHLALVDFNKDCCETLFINRPNCNIIHADVKNISISFKDVDLICGGPPCQPFSSIGKKKGFDDFRSMVFESFVTIVRIVQPKMFLIENVPNLCTINQGKDFHQLLYTLFSCGYQFYCQILNANCFNVPQNRKRLFIVGCRNNLKKTGFLFPQGINIPDSFNMRRALYNVPKSNGMQYSDYKKSVMDLVPEGGNWRDLPKNIADKYMKNINPSKGGCSGVARRLSWDKASPTLLCSPCQKLSERCHPNETRPLTIREYARIQTFPDDYQFFGSITSQYRQIGNAIPINLATSIGNSVKKHLELINE